MTWEEDAEAQRRLNEQAAAQNYAGAPSLANAPPEQGPQYSSAPNEPNMSVAPPLAPPQQQQEQQQPQAKSFANMTDDQLLTYIDTAPDKEAASALYSMHARQLLKQQRGGGGPVKYVEKLDKRSVTEEGTDPQATKAYQDAYEQHANLKQVSEFEDDKAALELAQQQIAKSAVNQQHREMADGYYKSRLEQARSERTKGDWWNSQSGGEKALHILKAFFSGGQYNMQRQRDEWRKNKDDEEKYAAQDLAEVRQQSNQQVAAEQASIAQTLDKASMAFRMRAMTSDDPVATKRWAAKSAEIDMVKAKLGMEHAKKIKEEKSFKQQAIGGGGAPKRDFKGAAEARAAGAKIMAEGHGKLQAPLQIGASAYEVQPGISEEQVNKSRDQVQSSEVAREGLNRLKNYYQNRSGGQWVKDQLSSWTGGFIAPSAEAQGHISAVAGPYAQGTGSGVPSEQDVKRVQTMIASGGEESLVPMQATLADYDKTVVKKVTGRR